MGNADCGIRIWGEVWIAEFGFGIAEWGEVDCGVRIWVCGLGRGLIGECGMGIAEWGEVDWGMRIWDCRLGGGLEDLGMRKTELQERMMKFALQMLEVAERLPKTVSGRTISNQMARSGTSVAANYRAACRGKSRADFISKLGTVEEEADETLFWLEMIEQAELLPIDDLRPHQKEADELISIVVSSINTARRNKKS